MVYMLISSYQTMNLSKILMILCIFPLIMLPYLLDKIKWYHMNEFFIFFYYLFILLALVMGSILKLYYQIWWFDLLAHFSSGVLSSIVAHIILEKSHLLRKDKRLFNFIFIILFTIAIAACWEYFEFFCDKISGGDTQWVAETGVDDTMTDMLIATFGGILTSVFFYYYDKKNNWS